MTRGLHETGSLEATGTARSINRTVITPSFPGVFPGTTALAVAGTMYSARN